MSTKVRNFIGGDWRESGAVECLDVVNPATAEVLGKVPLSPAPEVDEAAHAAAAAFPEFRAGRLPHLSFRGLLSVHSRFGLHAR